MANQTVTKEYTIDAKDRKIGRVATEVAVLLMGKNDPSFARNQVTDVKVTVMNASLLDIPEKKKDTKMYRHHTGHPGGLKEETLSHLAGRKGYGELIREAVSGMLPKNKLRSRMLKNLIITE